MCVCAFARGASALFCPHILAYNGHFQIRACSVSREAIQPLSSCRTFSVILEILVRIIGYWVFPDFSGQFRLLRSGALMRHPFFQSHNVQSRALFSASWNPLGPILRVELVREQLTPLIFQVRSGPNCAMQLVTSMCDAIRIAHP